MKPRIALTLSRQDTPGRRRAAAFYQDALERAGAEVIAIEPTQEAPADFDGLCLSGGGDVEPGRYGADDVASRDIDPARDVLELSLARRALAGGLPVLGICRGFQVLNVHLGGTLVQHVDGHRKENGPVALHIAQALPGSRLAFACGSAPFQVNSYHHQAVTPRELADGLRATVTIDGFVEAFESADERWILGVQWHPERDDVAPDAKGIFGAFVRAAYARAVPSLTEAPSSGAPIAAC